MSEDCSKIETTAERRLPPNAGKGRPVGVPNKSTSAARESIARFVDGNVERLRGLLEELERAIAKEVTGFELSFKHWPANGEEAK
jgi:hypothetical protein